MLAFALAGVLLSGFRFYLLIVGPFLLIREGERIRSRWNLDWGRACGFSLANGVLTSMPSAKAMGRDF